MYGCHSSSLPLCPLRPRPLPSASLRLRTRRGGTFQPLPHPHSRRPGHAHGDACSRTLPNCPRVIDATGPRFEVLPGLGKRRPTSQSHTHFKSVSTQLRLNQRMLVSHLVQRTRIELALPLIPLLSHITARTASRNLRKGTTRWSCPKERSLVLTAPCSE